MKIKIQKSQKIYHRSIASLHEQTFKSIEETRKTGMEVAAAEGKDQLSIVALDKAKVVGYALAQNGYRSVYLNWLGVNKNAKNLGVANSLNKSVEAWARRNKAKSIMLDTRNRFREALSLYLKSGYDIIGTWENRDGELMIRLRKKL